jgi:uncharacterized protein
MVQKTLLSDTPEILIKKYAQVLLKSGISLDRIILFGSYAKKTNKPWSDIDVCVVSKQFGKHRLLESMDLAALATQVDSMIEPHPFHPDDLLDQYDPLASEIRKYGIEVV